MDLSFLNKYKLNENNKINIYGNFLIDDVKKNINKENLKYINYFNNNNEIDNKNEIIIEYFFIITLIEKNIEMLLDSNSILEGSLLNNKYNNYLTEDNIILLFMRIKLFIFKNLNELVQVDDFFQNVFEKKIMNYENILEKETKLLEKELDIEIKKKLINKEIFKVKIHQMEFFLILSFYFNKNKDNLLEFIDKVEIITNKFIEINFDNNLDNKFIEINLNNNLNNKLELYWKHLITSI